MPQTFKIPLKTRLKISFKLSSANIPITQTFTGDGPFHTQKRKSILAILIFNDPKRDNPWRARWRFHYRFHLVFFTTPQYSRWPEGNFTTPQPLAACSHQRSERLEQINANLFKQYQKAPAPAPSPPSASPGWRCASTSVSMTLDLLDSSKESICGTREKKNGNELFASFRIVSNGGSQRPVATRAPMLWGRA